MPSVLGALLAALALTGCGGEDPSGDGAGGSAGSGGGGGAAGSGGEGGAGGAAGGGAGGGPSLADLVYPPGSDPLGTSYEDWSVAWWKWALAIEKFKNPMMGGACDESQPSNAFFLAGNTGQVETRSCTIPATQPIFFPILNRICRPCHEYEGCATNITEAQLTTCASGISDSLLGLSAELDGEVLAAPETYLATSMQFSWPPPIDPVFPCLGTITANACGIPEGDRYGVSSGYWVMLKPLPAGEHVLRFQGTLDKGNNQTFALDVTYNLTITP